MIAAPADLDCGRSGVRGGC